MAEFKFNQEPFTPGKIVCIGRNYAGHISELGNEVPEDMVVFGKPTSCVTDHLVAVHDEPLHYETELSFLIRNNEYVGIGVGLDLTKRQLQSKLTAKGLPWERAKTFTGGATFSEFVPLDDEIKNYSFTLHINDELTQQGDPSLMLYKPDIILKELNRFLPLQDNDILMTGTPKGVGVVTAGADFCARVYKGSELIIEKHWTGK